MRKNYGDGSDLKVRFIGLLLTIAAMIILAAAHRDNTIYGAATGPVPRVVAITQITRDGYRKSNLLAGDAQLYVTELPTTNRVIAKVTIPGSERSVVASTLPSTQALDVSPDHSKLLVSSAPKGSAEPELWTLPVAKGTPQRVGDLTGRDATWSPDGKQIAFAKGSTVNIANADGSGVHKLYAASGSVFAVRFSPDGRRVRFTISDTEQNTTTLWEVARDGSNPHQILKNLPYSKTVCCGSWTTDGRYYIFQMSQNVANTNLIVTSLWALPETEDSIPVQITEGPMSFGNASAGQNGKQIWAIGVNPSVEVVKYEAQKKQYVPLIPGLSATDVDFSGDGKWIAYVSVPGGALWRARADGSDGLQLSPDGERAALPHWSPDGKTIAYASMKPGGVWKLTLVSPNGGDSREMLPEKGSQIDANWSPDSKRIMFGDYNKDAAGLKIRIIDLATRAITNIPGSDGFFSPRWSPDGRYIAALSPDSTKLMLFDSKTQKWSTWLKETAGTVSYPSWSGDSEYLYFDDFVNDAEAIRRVKVGSSQTEEVFVLGNIERYPGPLGPWSGRAADGSWMFVRDRSTQEVYQLSMEMP